MIYLIANTGDGLVFWIAWIVMGLILLEFIVSVIREFLED